MSFLDSNQQRAALLLGLLMAALAIALAPYATGLLGIPVLYVIMAPLHRWLHTRVGPRTSATLVVGFGVFLILVPGLAFAGVVVNEARQIAAGVIRSPILDHLTELHIGEFPVGPRLAKLGEQVVQWLGSSAFNLIGTATRLALNVAIAFFGLFYLLIRPGDTWDAVRPYIPFSKTNADKLRRRFEDVTISTLIGTGLTAVVQGLLLGLGFWAADLPNPVFWGVVAAVFAILPVVGSAFVWIPATIALVLDGRYGWAVGLALWGAVVVSSVDNVIRPLVFNRWANIHPLITLVGAFAGVRFFGILGLLIGPLALSYFFELIRMYREEYLKT